MKSGTHAFRMAASPLAIRICPHRIKLNGITWLSVAMIANASHACPGVGSRCPVATRVAPSAAASGATRTSSTVNGGSAASATF